MAMKPCRKCGYEVSTFMRSCPQCSTDAPTRGGSDSWRDKALWMLGIVLIPIVGFLIPRDADDDVGIRGVEAYVVCKELVTQRLRTPATAKFSGWGTRDVRADYKGDGRYLVTGHVDAQNLFGALIRSSWRCEVEYVDDGQWRSILVAVG